jgi:hypothetical protein
MLSAKARRQPRHMAVPLTLALLLVAAAALLPRAAGAEEAPERDRYVAALETICKPRAQATERAVKGAKGDISAERLKVAAGKFRRASRIFSTTVSKMAVVPRPAADAARLKNWFVFLGRQEDYLQRMVRKLEAGRAVEAQRLVARFIHNGNLANEAVLAFGFDYCAFKFSRYG